MSVRALSHSQLQWFRSKALASNDEQISKLIEEIELAPTPTKRPIGGKGWKNFPIDELRGAINKLKSLKEKQQLISHIVQWHKATTKESSK